MINIFKKACATNWYNCVYKTKPKLPCIWTEA